MKGKAAVTGLCGLLLLTTPAFADPPVVSTEKAYRLLQVIASQLKEAQASLSPHGSTQATAALASAEEQVRLAFAHCCHALHTAQLKAAKSALAQHNRQEALQHLLKADEILETCAEHSPVTKPQEDQETPHLKSALAQR